MQRSASGPSSRSPTSLPLSHSPCIFVDDGSVVPLQLLERQWATATSLDTGVIHRQVLPDARVQLKSPILSTGWPLSSLSHIPKVRLSCLKTSSLAQFLSTASSTPGLSLYVSSVHSSTSLPEHFACIVHSNFSLQPSAFTTPLFPSVSPLWK
ncbi:hypothetical protein F5J12DRAFT_62192 [Pisolithus orientalis]|uniref:uncharacterized protein n=1 Tax=Pisolithus orientalis TaxID=936130 RepID=UPI0022244B38|nr:uncharacterized protein F5J12DRAFT_62192 [Pisolithus orientalis]KAI5984902.1 hypothetical protein F5J12DRAFT_62192 [Pisolithus orientalis]